MDGEIGKDKADGLIVQRLEDELLVYDTESDEAHCLDPAAAAEFEAADNDVSRREVIRRLALVGVAAAGAAPLVKSIVAPAPAQAVSGTPCGSGGGICPAGTTCCAVPANVATCCNNASQTCCNTATGVCCDNANQVCVANQCIVPSDRNLKHHLAPVDPQDVLAAVGL